MSSQISQEIRCSVEEQENIIRLLNSEPKIVNEFKDIIDFESVSGFFNRINEKSEIKSVVY